MDGGAYARWNRVALGTLCAGLVLIAAAIYGVTDGDDVYGLANTLLPALACLGLWRLAVWRRDR
jgi:hypothetical protein